MGFASVNGSAYVAQMKGSGQSPAEIRLEQVACARGGRVLFDRIDVSLSAGEALLVTGPNGIGKSSLLRMIAGLLPVTAGRLATRGKIALADERSALDLERPLAAALGFWAKIDGGDVEAALAATGLQHLRDVPVRMLSTGQSRRAGLARTVTACADIWLLDEPGNGLDTDSLVRLTSMIESKCASGGIVVVASHQAFAIKGARKLELA